MDRKIDDGGPAYPKAGLDPWQNAKAVHIGMSLRDYFAAKAMQGICSISEDAGARHWTPDGIAESAYAQADAMLKARAS